MDTFRNGFRFGPAAICTLVLGLALGAGCRPDQDAPAAASAATNAAPVATTNITVRPAGKPQPKLPVLNLWIGTNQIAAELAMTVTQVQTGMMFRTEMGENEGMLFVFAVPHRASFYMRNTLIPLSCAYIGSDGKILELHDMKPLDETPILAGTDQVQFVLEMKHGWFQRHGVKPGDVVGTERGTMQQTFFGMSSQGR